MAFWYSVRLSRRNVPVRPGSGFQAAARSSEPASMETNASYLRRVRSHLVRRRHLASDELPHDLLPGLRVPAHVLAADRVEGQARRLVVAVMACDAVQIDEPTDRFALVRTSRRGAAQRPARGCARIQEAADQEHERHSRRVPRIRHRFMRPDSDINDR